LTKRGAVAVPVYFTIFEVILLAVVIVIVAKEVSNIDESSIFQKKFFSRDIALLLDSMTNARGNFFYVYNPNTPLEKYELDFSNGRVSVDGESWPYAKNSNLKFSPEKIKNANLVVFKKTGNTIEIAGRDVDAESLILDCPYAHKTFSSVVLDPGHGYDPVSQQGDEGFKIKAADDSVISESRTVLGIAASLKSLLGSVLSTRKLGLTVRSVNGKPVQVEDAKTTEERIEFIDMHPEAAVISLHFGKDVPENNIIKAFVRKDADDAAFGLACRILNAIAGRKEFKNRITGTAVVPVDLGQFSPTDPKQVLKTANVAVQLELGNIGHPDNPLISGQQAVAAAIKQGMGT
jgi:hypothetical protein